jgi:hypothetical protein
VNRADFQQLAEERLVDADVLLAAQRWSGAYYLSGYAIECGLKACIAKLTNEHDFPDKAFAQRCYTHNLDTLLDAARLKLDLDSDMRSNLQLAANWATTRAWNEDSRYEVKTHIEAIGIYNAVADQSNGVMQWIKVRW